MKKILSNPWEIENKFYLNSDPSRLKKIICHYEIFKKTANISGSIVECGVFKGNSLIRFITFRDMLSNNKKKVVGFDVFGKFPRQQIKQDNKFAKHHDKNIGLGINFSKLLKTLKSKKFKNFSLTKGPIEKTLKIFLKKNKNFKISFLHLDLDVYKPTYYALNKLYKKVSKGGIILLDDYGKIQGATKATNDFLRINKLNIKIQSTIFDKKLKFIIKK
jgi:hypothetical protein